MSKYYKRGKFINKSRSLYLWENLTNDFAVSGKFVKVLIVRGIGYRAFALNNDLLNNKPLSNNFIESLRPVYTDLQREESQELTQVGRFEFSNQRYLIVRAGHTRDLNLPLREEVSCVTRKKDRKLVVMSENNILASNLARSVHLYRAPSVYTGRGVRIKHLKPLRKAGKKDKQRGKAF